MNRLGRLAIIVVVGGLMLSGCGSAGPQSEPFSGGPESATPTPVQEDYATWKYADYETLLDGANGAEAVDGTLDSSGAGKDFRFRVICHGDGSVEIEYDLGEEHHVDTLDCLPIGSGGTVLSETGPTNITYSWKGEPGPWGIGLMNVECVDNDSGDCVYMSEVDETDFDWGSVQGIEEDEFSIQKPE